MWKRTRNRAGLALLAVVLPLGVLTLGVTPAEARKADYIPDAVVKKKKKKKKKKPKDGWHPSLSAGFNFAFSQSQGVVGVPDGISMALGLQLNGGLIFRHKGHEWISRLNIVHTQSKIPNIDPFIKSADQFELESLYQYRFQKFNWFGVFAGLRLTTALLPGNLVLQEGVNLELQMADGTTVLDNAEAQKPYQLTKSFAPMLFKQFAGALAKPLEKKWLNIDVRLGLGAVEVFTRDGYVVNDDKDTPILELKQLEDYVQAGVELQVRMQGVAVNKILSYALSAEFMYPFADNVDTELSGAELINAEFRFTLGIKLFKWAALNYSLAVLRYPLIVDKWQVTNSLMLSITANIVK